MIQCETWPSSTYVVQRYGNTFDLTRSLPETHQLALHRRRIESVTSDIQQQAQQALNTPASRIPRHQPAYSAARGPSGSQASQAHNTSLGLTPILLITMCILPLLRMTLGNVGQDSAVHVGISYMGANRSFPSSRASYTITSLPPGYTSNPPFGS